MGRITTAGKQIFGAVLQGENPLPFFRDPKHNTAVELEKGFPERYTEYLGYETGYRVLPYSVQDRYTRERRMQTFDTIVLENDILRAEFLPRYGARLISLFSKKDNRELLYRNKVFQPANLAIRNAWFSGGIEWNMGQYGHAFSTCSPVFCAVFKDEKGEDFLRMYDYERCRGLYWQIDFYLPEGSPFLHAHTRICNPARTETPVYYWTNIALAQTDSSRVFSPSAEVIYLEPLKSGGKKRFGFGALPAIDIMPDTDVSYPDRLLYSNEYFFTCDREQMPWEVALESDGSGFFEASTNRLKYRKMFCWGRHPGGRRWPQFLSDGTQSYYEIQSGLVPTQLHGMVIPAETSWSWTEVFGSIAADPRKSHGLPWREARDHVADCVHKYISVDDLYRSNDAFIKLEDAENGRIIANGTGWGALEAERRKRAGLSAPNAAFNFPPSSMNEEQQPWKLLLEEGILPPKNPEELPWSWMVQSEWEEMLIDSLHICGKNSLWNTYLHLGVMEMEKGNREEAISRWKSSIDAQPNAWAYRNLAAAEKSAGNAEAALAYYRLAWRSPGGQTDKAIAEEFFVLLVEQKKISEAHLFYDGLLPAWKDTDRIAIQYGYIAAAEGNEKELERILDRDFANIREGETPLSDLWFELEAQRTARIKDIPLTDELRADIKKHSTPPFRLDFRMH